VRHWSIIAVHLIATAGWSAAAADPDGIAHANIETHPNASRSSTPVPEKSNVIFIMADDLGYGDLGCFGQKLIQTPNIDQLAREGTRFTQFYAGSAVCAPTRCALMTGLHSGHGRVRNNKSPVYPAPEGRVPLLPEDVTVAEVFKQAGYATGMVGKWGLGDPGTTGVPNKQGFDYWFGYLNQKRAHTYYPDYVWQNETKFFLPGNLDGRRDQWTPDLMTSEALTFVERNKDRPFFLYLPYTIPHGAYEIASDAPYSDRDWEDPQKKYAAMITRMDRDIGLLMKRLSELGLDDRTLVLFTSDNGTVSLDDGKLGLFNGNGPFSGTKGTVREGGIRAPLIARWPRRIDAGATSEHVWAMWDFLPTMADLIGVKPPEKIDGVSKLPALLGREQKQEKFLYWEYGGQKHLDQAVRMGDWKAIRSDFGALQLYDLSVDVAESRDVAADHADVVAEIEGFLETARMPSKEWPTEWD
jgi:arylsulfatase A-like enzyme